MLFSILCNSYNLIYISCSDKYSSSSLCLMYFLADFFLSVLCLIFASSIYY